MAKATKKCPMCAEEVQAAARICRFCRYEFLQYAYLPADRAQHLYRMTTQSKVTIVVVGLIIVAVFLGIYIDPPSVKPASDQADATASSEAVEQASQDAADHQSGKDCLYLGMGYPDLEVEIENQLRDPDSYHNRMESRSPRSMRMATTPCSFGIERKTGSAAIMERLLQP